MSTDAKVRNFLRKQLSRVPSVATPGAYIVLNKRSYFRPSGQWFTDFDPNTHF